MNVIARTPVQQWTCSDQGWLTIRRVFVSISVTWFPNSKVKLVVRLGFAVCWDSFIQLFYLPPAPFRSSEPVVTTICTPSNGDSFDGCCTLQRGVSRHVGGSVVRLRPLVAPLARCLSPSASSTFSDSFDWHQIHIWKNSSCVCMYAHASSVRTCISEAQPTGYLPVGKYRSWSINRKLGSGHNTFSWSGAWRCSYMYIYIYIYIYVNIRLYVYPFILILPLLRRYSNINKYYHKNVNHMNVF